MKKMLCIGINHFLHPGNDLSGCVNDAWAMKEIAELLGVESPTVLVDDQVTKLNVMAHLVPAVDEAKIGRLTYLGLAYSAHGTHYPRPEEEDGLGEALCCYDTAEKDGDWNPDTIIKDSELNLLLNQVPLTCTVEVWLDTCYSGGMDRAWGRTNRYLHNPGNAEKLIRLSDSTVTKGLNKNIIVWQACSEAQTSADAFIEKGWHGAFSYAWIRAFNSNPRDSRVGILLSTRKWLSINKYSQFPRLKCWNAPAQRACGM